MKIVRGTVYFYDEDNVIVAYRSYRDKQHFRWSLAYMAMHLKRKNKKIHYIQICPVTNDKKINNDGRNNNG